MKKFLLLFTFIFTITFTSFGQTPLDISLWGGYSWLNGVFGVEAQFGQIGISGGWYPAKMPYSNDPISSFSGAITIYGKNNKYLDDHYGSFSACYYGSFGIASAGYRYESYSGSSIYDTMVQPMYIVIGGVKSYVDRWQFKLGMGYGWCDQAGVFTWEIGLSYAIISSH